MALPEMCSPIPEIPVEDKRQLEEFLLEEYIAVEHFRNPDTSLRKPRTIYPFIANAAVDLTPMPTSPGTDMWADFRKGAIGELNYPRWSHTYEIDGALHTVTLHHAIGENTGGEYNYRTLRCSCCLPDIRDRGEFFADYNPCPAKDMVIAERGQVYKQIFGQEALPPSRARREVFAGALNLVMNIVKRDPFSWPPSHRNDRLQIGGVAVVFGLSVERVYEEAKQLEETGLVIVHEGQYPSISILN